MLFYIGLFLPIAETMSIFRHSSYPRYKSDLVLTRYRHWILDLDVVTWTLRAVNEHQTDTINAPPCGRPILPGSVKISHRLSVSLHLLGKQDKFNS